MSSDRVKKPTLADLVTDPALLAALTRFVGARIPGSEVDDIVQSVVAEAIVSTHAPTKEEEVAPWVHGIARHKVVDWFRAHQREVPQDPELQDEAAVSVRDTSLEARDLYRWAQKELPEGEENAKTLEWMLREGAGEKLETIAAEANVPAPRVRQRVSRLRRHYKERWAAQAAALAALLAVIVAIVIATRRKQEQIAPLPAPSALPSPSALPEPTVVAPQPTPEERAAELRQDALKKCGGRAWQECLDGLDAARALDPAGESDPSVKAARAKARNGLRPKPVSTGPTSSWSSSDTPPTSTFPQKPFSKKAGGFSTAPAPSGFPEESPAKK
jgi:RNA polymerase sigma factor (sigma-70 family)